MHIQRAEAAYKQLAAVLREGITTGRYAPGSLLPSESTLMREAGVSRHTVRSAIAVITAEGLVTVRHGKGAIVRGGRPTAAPAATLPRAVHRTGRRYQQPTTWQQAAPATIYRTRTDPTTAALLGVGEQEECFAVERILTWTEHEDVRTLHRTLLPLQSIQDTALATAPDTEPADAYTILTAAGHGPLSWAETVTARMPTPDETADLNMSKNTPVLVTTRTTRAANGTPLMLETQRTPADAAQLAYTITAGRSRTAR